MFWEKASKIFLYKFTAQLMEIKGEKMDCKQIAQSKYVFLCNSKKYFFGC